MARKANFLITALVAGLGMFAAVPADAQSPTTPTWQDAISEHHQLQYRMMDEMTREMTRMTERMSRGALSPEDSKKMSDEMSRMARMMRFMSGLEARPAHTHAQLQEQMDQMRAQMNEMTSNSRRMPSP